MSRWLAVFVLVLTVALGVDAPWPGTAAAVPALFIVTSTGDDAGTTCAATCTLRQAITNANTNGNPTQIDRIAFNIAGGGVKTITLTGQLPNVSQPVRIEGDSQPLASCGPNRNLLIQINGAGVAPIGMFLAHADASAAFGSTIRGLAIFGATGYQVSLGQGTGHLVECSNIGTNAAGTEAAGIVTDVGIFAASQSTAPIIGGTTAAHRNIIGNTEIGVFLASPGSSAAGNYIGVGVDGVTPIGNLTGVKATGTGSTVGGPNIGSLNVITGNDLGVLVAGSGVTIKSNVIGLASDFETAVGNVGHGIRAESALNLRVSNNAISSNGGSGISLEDSNGVDIFTNAIGTDLAADLPRGNAAHGIEVIDSTDIAIGVEGANVISANRASGIYLLHATASDIRSNYIGYTSGLTPLRNLDGAILVEGETSGITIGGQAIDSGNQVYAEGHEEERNSAIEVREANGTPVGVGIFGNSLNSDGHAINLRPAGELPNTVTANDPGDLDLGPNALQNFPVITAVIPGATPHVTATLAVPAGDYIISFYASETCDSATARQAERHLGAAVVPLPAGGGSFTLILGANVDEGEFVTATATPQASLLNTSELSPCARASTGPVVQDVTPREIVAGTLEVEVQVEGTNFTEDSVVTWDGEALPTEYLGPTSLTATVTRAGIGFSGAQSRMVAVDNGGGLVSNELAIEIVPSSADANCDNDTSAEDATFLLRFLAGLEQPSILCPLDANHDGDIDLADVLRIRKEVALLIDFPLPKLEN